MLTALYRLLIKEQELIGRDRVVYTQMESHQEEPSTDYVELEDLRT